MYVLLGYICQLVLNSSPPSDNLQDNNRSITTVMQSVSTEANTDETCLAILFKLHPPKRLWAQCDFLSPSMLEHGPLSGVF